MGGFFYLVFDHVIADAAPAVVTDEYLTTEYDISRCSYQLFSSNMFATHADYVRRQIIYGLLQVCRAQLSSCSRLFATSRPLPPIPNLDVLIADGPFGD